MWPIWKNCELTVISVNEEVFYERDTIDTEEIVRISSVIREKLLIVYDVKKRGCVEYAPTFFMNFSVFVENAEEIQKKLTAYVFPLGS